jgi:hypothetical protein
MPRVVCRLPSTMVELTDLSERCDVRTELVDDDHRRHEALPLQQFPDQLRACALVALGCTKRSRTSALVVGRTGRCPIGWTSRSRPGTKVFRSRRSPLSPTRPRWRSQNCGSCRPLSYAEKTTSIRSAATISADAHGRVLVQPSARPEFRASGDPLLGAPRLFRSLRPLEPSWLGPNDGLRAGDDGAVQRHHRVGTTRDRVRSRPDGLGRGCRLRPYLRAVDPTFLIMPPSRVPTFARPYRPR